MRKKYAEIPIKPYLKKYTQYIYGAEIPLVRNRLVLTNCDNYFNFNRYFGRYSTDESLVTLEVELHSCDEAVKYAFVRYVHNLFHNEFYHYVRAHVSAGAVAKHTILRFMQQYGITEDDYKYETAKKRWDRYNKENPRTLLIAA